MRIPGKNIFTFISSSLLLLLANLAFAQQATEYQVKAAYIYNFTKFVEWPAQVLSNNSEPFIVGIVGADPFGKHLSEIVDGELAFGKPIVIRHFSGTDEIGFCHILYLNVPEKETEIIRLMAGKPVLTISDDAVFCEHGGAIRFFPENEMIRLEINQKAAKAANLSISSKLLRIAKLCQ